MKCQNCKVRNYDLVVNGLYVCYACVDVFKKVLGAK
jgi:hypothetical protein